MKSQIKVVKTDSTVEEYLHTKIIGTINNALSAAGQAEAMIAEEFAEAVTDFLYNKQHSLTVTTSEIFSIVKTLLATTGYERAAILLDEHRCRRKLKRKRIEVIDSNIKELSDVLMLLSQKTVNKSRWNKSIIVHNLVNCYAVNRQLARTVASMVEEKIFAMKISIVTTGLIKQLVLADYAMLMRANEQLDDLQVDGLQATAT